MCGKRVARSFKPFEVFVKLLGMSSGILVASLSHVCIALGYLSNSEVSSNNLGVAGSGDPSLVFVALPVVYVPSDDMAKSRG